MAIVWESMYDEVYKYRKVRGEIDIETKNESGERLINPKSPKTEGSTLESIKVLRL